MGWNEAATIAIVLKTPSANKFLESSGSGWKDASARAPRSACQSPVGVAEREQRCTFATSRRPRFSTRSPWRPDAPGSCTSTGWESRRCACLLAALAPSQEAARSGDGPHPSCRPSPFLFVVLLQRVAAAPVKERSGRPAGGRVFNLEAWGHLKLW